MTHKIPDIFTQLNKAQLRKDRGKYISELVSSSIARTKSLLLAAIISISPTDFSVSNNRMDNLGFSEQTLLYYKSMTQAGFPESNFLYGIATDPDIINHLSIFLNPEILRETIKIYHIVKDQTGINYELIDMLALAYVIEAYVSTASDPVLYEDRVESFLSVYSSHAHILAQLFPSFEDREIKA